MNSRPELKLDWCGHDAAEYACQKWHYSQTVPKAKRVYIGVWEDRRFIGVVIFSTGSGAATDGTKYGLAHQFEIAELQRVALAHDHRSPVTKILSVAIRMIQKKCSGLRALISFADPSEGHHGGIYQGGNWIYTGLSPDTTYFELSDGRWVHRRVVGRQFGRFEKAAGLKTGKTKTMPGKYRYLMPLDAEMRRRIEPLRKPYPKRASEVKDDTAGDHSAEGGETPTRTL